MGKQTSLVAVCRMEWKTSGDIQVCEDKSQDWGGAVETDTRDAMEDLVGFHDWVHLRGKAKGELEMAPALNLNAQEKNGSVEPYLRKPR